MRDLTFFNSLPPDQKQAVLDSPSLEPPPGVIPNLINPPNHNFVGYAVITASAVICGTLVIARLYARAFYHKRVEIEDYAAIAALAVLSGFFYCMWMIVRSPGLFVHQWNVPVKSMYYLLHYLHFGSIAYGIVIMFLKISILLEWARTFVPRGIRNTFWWTCHAVLAVNVVFYIICTCIQLFACPPSVKEWKPSLPAKCLDLLNMHVASASINFVSDLIILLLPQKTIWGMRMAFSKKLRVAGLFAVGCLASSFAGVRIASIAKLVSIEDLTYTASDTMMWCIAEMSAGFFVLCFPSLRKMFVESTWIQRAVSPLRWSTRSSSNDATSKNSKSVPQLVQWKSRSANSDEWEKVAIKPLTTVIVASDYTTRTEAAQPYQST